MGQSLWINWGKYGKLREPGKSRRTEWRATARTTAIVAVILNVVATTRGRWRRIARAER